ncbi:uncharacterized protein LOC120015097 [Tripterygium wilfordii]|nr:uncharacterized protein LOC120015097 [Tripterygium wilfordii]
MSARSSPIRPFPFVSHGTCLAPLSSSSSNLNLPVTSLASPRLRSPDDEPIRIAFASSMPRNLILRRISPNRIQDPRSFRFNSNIMKHMETKNDRPPQEQSTKVKEEEKEPKKVPPPPEKPLPGDCCGSGCVRCVWDVYYDELEEYNKLYKTGSNKPESDPS